MPQVEMRSAQSVWQQLLAAMTSTVTEYHPSVLQTPTRIDQLIDGTAVFPGGSGLWRGSHNGGSLPQLFPHKPVMFVAHNFDKKTGFERSLKGRGEAGETFWKTLIAICAKANVRLESCFFTNALMGLQPLKAQGSMPSTPVYLQQCDRFLLEQIRLVDPTLVVSLGEHAKNRIDQLPTTLRQTSLRHPSALTYVKSADRNSWIDSEAKKLAAAL